MNRACNVNGNWWTAKEYALPGNTKYVAIEARNPNHNGGILASFSNDVVTDESWQCADMNSCHLHWRSCNWRRAISYGSNNNSTRTVLKGKIPKIERKAQWIWVNDQSTTWVKCKKTFSK